ncbi:ribosomal protein S18-alanine N-acetyltransferase [Halorussus limi]|uniref:Ribosomal protein S18-alanine N-acetyltransferase n=1 Tax=Halorussus limi TaxID=2938695 RepID=A0A8U0HYA2_9EURY|nr:ribosomal protein S18-alanine N-acetyltransferase [Halorussus limi]UPV76135.1 ribosomal protein S18-alanine N-acetyltransferase [Halorussus limi]
MTTAPAEDGDDVRIRRAVQADLLAVLRIERASFDQPWPFSAFERYLGDPGFLVAVTNEESAGYFDGDGDESVVGYVVANLVPNHGRAFGHVKDIAVHPDYRGEGIGAGLLDRALTVLGTRGAQSVKLEVRASNDRAVSLYRDFDFEYLRTIPRYYDDGEDALILVVDLDE